MKEEIKKHFKSCDPALYKIAVRAGVLKPIVPIQPGRYFHSLCRKIISQQLSSAAADAILRRFFVLFSKGTPTPKLLAGISEEALRATGMSWAKARYVKALAQCVEAKELRLAGLVNLSDEDAVAELTRVKGVGRWTAEMFLLSSLGREDIFSYEDRGLQRAMERLYGMEAFSRKAAEPIVEQWKPYRSWACRLLWDFTDR